MAIRTLTQALKTDPVHPGALYIQALLLAKHDQLDGVNGMMQAVFLQSPEDTKAYYQLAQWLAKKGDTRNTIRQGAKDNGLMASIIIRAKDLPQATTGEI